MRKMSKWRFDFSKVYKYKFFGFASAVVNPLFKLIYGLKTEGIENIPKDGGVIIASNHRSYLDPVLVGLSIHRKTKRQVHYMAKQELFKNPILRWLIVHLNAYPVHRGAGDTSAIDYSIKLLNEGDMMAIFPEGTRSKTGIPGKAKAGVVVISQATGADIVPCAIIVRKAKIPCFKRITIRFGERIKNSELNIDEENKNRSIKAVCTRLMDDIRGLMGLNGPEGENE